MTDKQCSAGTADPKLVNELAAWLIALEDASMYEPVPASLVEHGRIYIHGGLNEQHSGDCTNQSHTCIVCSASDAIDKAKQILAALAPMLVRSSAESDPTHEQLAEWVQHLDWDAALSTADEIKQLRALLRRIGYRSPSAESDPGRYSFDDLSFGWTNDGMKLDRKMVARPPGLKNEAWYRFAGDLIRALPQKPQEPKTLWGMIADIYGELDPEDCAMIDREWAKMRGYILPTNGTSTLKRNDQGGNNG